MGWYLLVNLSNIVKLTFFIKMINIQVLIIQFFNLKTHTMKTGLMKKAFLILLSAVCLLANAQTPLQASGPLAALVHVDTTGMRLVRQLADLMITSDKPCLMRDGLETGKPYLKQVCIVFIAKEKRFSLYYQWNERDFNYDNGEFFSLFVRPEGTKDRQHLRGFKDLYLNGTPDEIRFSGELFGWLPFIGTKFEEKHQAEFIYLLKIAIAYLQ